VPLLHFAPLNHLLRGALYNMFFNLIYFLLSSITHRSSVLDFDSFKISHHPPMSLHAILVFTRQSIDSRWQLLDCENSTSIRRSQVSELPILIWLTLINLVTPDIFTMANTTLKLRFTSVARTPYLFQRTTLWIFCWAFSKSKTQLTGHFLIVANTLPSLIG
jgi:hypothetical protein